MVAKLVESKLDSNQRPKLAIEYRVSAVKVDIARCSEQCRKTVAGLIVVNDDAILTTPFVQNYTEIMFKRVFWQLMINAFIDTLFTVLLTIGTLFADKSTTLHVFLFLFILYWIIVEVVLLIMFG